MGDKSMQADGPLAAMRCSIQNSAGEASARSPVIRYLDRVPQLKQARCGTCASPIKFLLSAPSEFWNQN